MSSKLHYRDSKKGEKQRPNKFSRSPSRGATYDGYEDFNPLKKGEQHGMSIPLKSPQQEPFLDSFDEPVEEQYVLV